MGLKGVDQRLIRSLERRVRRKWRLQEEAEDVVAESLANAVARAQSTEVRSLYDYMNSAVDNKARDVLRKRGVRERAADKLSIEAEPQGSGMEDACMNKDLLGKVLQELPEEQQQIVLLSFQEGLTLREIAQKLGMGDSKVQRSFNQAMERCVAIASRLQGDEK